MGVYDYENLSKKNIFAGYIKSADSQPVSGKEYYIYDSKTGKYELINNIKFEPGNEYFEKRYTSQLVKLYNNENYCAYLSRNIFNTDEYGKILNRPCFKFTKLREDIFFIDTTLSYVDNDGKVYTTNFMFVINEKGFWKRFKIYLKSNPKKEYIDDDNGAEITIKNIISKRLDVDRIELVISDAEYGDMNANIFPDNSLVNRAISNGAICSFVNYTCYNKRVIIELLNNKTYTMRKIDGISEDSPKDTYSVILGPYKASEATDPTKKYCLVYNPDDIFYKKYRQMYT